MSDENLLQVSLANRHGPSLGPTVVGELRLLPGGQDSTEFRFDQTYLKSTGRPVLGQNFEDDLNRTYTSRVRAPAFFSNLLPEGVLREFLARRAGVSPAREFFLLAELGRDLPGGVIVAPVGRLNAAEGDVQAELQATTEPPRPLRFSLAGLQLKFSVEKSAGRWILPVAGEGGHWLLKVPHPDFPRVPQNEYLMMSWAREVGLDVPDVELVQLATVEGLPPELRFAEPEALLVRRFDRDGEARIHMEDFLQVLGKHPSDTAKYRATSYDGVAKILLMLENGGLDDVLEMVRRLVFNLAIGNGDAHLKNWSLLYDNPQWPRLAPAYDLVATRSYLPNESTTALNLARTKEYSAMTMGVFQAFARRLDVDPKPIEDEVRKTVARIRATWAEVQRSFPATPDLARAIERQLSEVPVLAV